MSEHTEDKIVDVILALILWGVICLAIYGLAQLAGRDYYYLSSALFSGYVLYRIYHRARAKTLAGYEAKKQAEAARVAAEFKEFIERFNTMESPEGTPTTKAEKSKWEQKAEEMEARGIKGLSEQEAKEMLGPFANKEQA